MRLACLDQGHQLPERVMLGLIGKAGKRSPPDILKTLMYRPEFFGMRFSALTQEIMRGESPWSVGERELFASFTSSLNQCVF